MFFCNGFVLCFFCNEFRVFSYGFCVFLSNEFLLFCFFASVLCFVSRFLSDLYLSSFGVCVFFFRKGFCVSFGREKFFCLSKYFFVLVFISNSVFSCHMVVF